MESTLKKLEDGTMLWENEEGLLHNEEGPAMVLPDKTMAWYKNGKIHSYKNQPALITPDGFKAWYENGVRHRHDGPAIIDPEKGESYYYFGYFAAEQEIFYLKAWRTEVEGLVSGINEAPDMSKYLKHDEDLANTED